MEDSIFTRIIKGEIPCHKIYEDAKTFAFLDIHPFVPGHILVVPKLQVDMLDELPDEDYQALLSTVKKLSKHARTTMGSKRSIVQVLGFDVPHAHVHILPANTTREFFEAVANHISDKPYPYQPTQDELAAIATKLRLPDEN